MKYFIQSYTLLLPLIVGGILHMFFVSKNYLSTLSIPLSKKWFGKNKTWRGFIIMPATTIMGVYVTRQFDSSLPPDLQVGMKYFSPSLLGLLLGIAYLVFELPNSLMKRRIGIKEGQLMAGHYQLAQVIIDQADSGFGCVLVYYFYMNQPIGLLISFLFIGTFTHLIINYLLYILKLRKQPL